MYSEIRRLYSGTDLMYSETGGLYFGSTTLFPRENLLFSLYFEFFRMSKLS